MKNLVTTAMLLASFTLFVGCATKDKGPAYGQQQEIRRQIADSIPVMEWGYSIADVRLSQDAQKVLVVFTLPGGTNGISEAVLEHDGFRRFKGSIRDTERSHAARRAFSADSAARSTAMVAHQSNLMARAKSGDFTIPPRPTPADDGGPAVESLLRAGSASIVVTLPDR
jgi:hypothetical protein